MGPLYILELELVSRTHVVNVNLSALINFQIFDFVKGTDI